MNTPTQHRRARGTANRADVAALAGVSPTTVTNVLTGKGYAGDDVRRRVLAAVEELGYQPNLIARGLATRKSGQVAVLVEDLLNPFMADMVAHICTKLHNHSMRSIIVKHAWADDSYAVTLARGVVDGVIVADPSGPEAARFVDVLLDRGIPLVTHGMEYERTIPSVNAQFELGVGQAVEHLRSLGHSRVVFVGEIQTLRYDWYMKHGNDLGLHVGDDLVVQTPIEERWSYRGGYEAGKELIARKTGATAVFAASDLVAHGVMRAIGECGLIIPKDISLIGWDDVPQSAYTWPGLTTIRVDREAIAESLVNCLVSSMNDEAMTINSIPTQLVVRESTGSPAKA